MNVVKALQHHLNGQHLYCRLRRVMGKRWALRVAGLLEWASRWVLYRRGLV